MQQQNELVNQLANLNEEFKKANDTQTSDTLDNQKLDTLNNMITDITAKINAINASQNRLSKSTDEQKSAVGSQSVNQFNISSDVTGMITAYLNQNSIIRQRANVMQVSSDMLEFVRSKNSVNAEWSSGSTAPNSIEGYEKIKIPLYDLMAQPKVTQRLLDDANIDFNKWFSSEIAQIFLESENAAFINGDGANKPKGILSYAGTSSDSIEIIKTGDATKITVDGLINFIYSLSDSYSQNAAIYMNKITVQEVRKMKDSNGQYLWMPGVLSGKCDTLMGIPLYTISQIPNPIAGNVCAIYADLKKCYTIADRKKIDIQLDPYTSKPFVSFYAIKGVGGDVTNVRAAKVLKISA